VSRSRAVDRATAWAFVLALLAPAVDHLIRAPEARSVQRENRRPAPLPEPVTDFASLSRFPSAFESWFSDRLGGRDLLLRGWQHNAWLRLGLDPPVILRGGAGCDFYAYGRTPQTHRGAAPFTVQELAAVTRSLESQRDRCRRLGAEFVCVFVPNKEVVYAEHWPARLARLGPSRLEQLHAWLKLHSDVRIVDLSGALVREREFDRPEVDDLVYYPLGSHFTWRGGLAAWNAIARELNLSFPGVQPLSREDYTLTESDAAGGDSLWDNTYVHDLVHQRTWWLEARPGAESGLVPDAAGMRFESRREDPALPTCVFVHDSYGPWMMPFAARSFTEFVALRSQRVPRDLIERRRPQIVIHEATERVLEWDLGEGVQDVEHVAGATFRAYEPCLGPFDFARDPVLVASGCVTIAPSDEGLRIEQRLGDGVVDLPAVALPPDADLAVHLVLVAPFDGPLHLYFQTKTEPRYGRARALALDLRRGENDLHLRLRVPELTGAVRLHCAGSGDYLLRALELRLAR
jgi:hypothetical protein